MAKRKQLRDEDVEMDGSANQGQEDDDGSDEVRICSELPLEVLT